MLHRFERYTLDEKEYEVETFAGEVQSVWMCGMGDPQYKLEAVDNQDLFKRLQELIPKSHFNSPDPDPRNAKIEELKKHLQDINVGASRLANRNKELERENEELRAEKKRFDEARNIILKAADALERKKPISHRCNCRSCEIGRKFHAADLSFEAKEILSEVVSEWHHDTLDLGMSNARLERKIEELERQLVLIGERAVVDFHDSVVGMVDAVVKEPMKYKDWIQSVWPIIRENESAKVNSDSLRPALTNADWGELEVARIKIKVLEESLRIIRNEKLSFYEELKTGQGIDTIKLKGLPNIQVWLNPYKSKAIVIKQNEAGGVVIPVQEIDNLIRAIKALIYPDATLMEGKTWAECLECSKNDIGDLCEKHQAGYELERAVKDLDLEREKSKKLLSALSCYPSPTAQKAIQEYHGEVPDPPTCSAPGDNSCP